MIRCTYRVVVLALALSLASWGFALDADDITVVSYNLWNYFLKSDFGRHPKSEESKNAVADTIAKANPDIVLVSEIGGKEAMADLLGRLRQRGLEYPFSIVMHGSDPTRALGAFAKFKPVEIHKLNTLTYNLRSKKAPKSAKPDKVRVQRGFLHLVFVKKGYRLHIISAHLKARLYNRYYSHSDMRRNEARLLRSVVGEIMRKEPESNILVTGDFNDTRDSGTIATIRGDYGKKSLALVDLRPLDADGCCWTHWWRREDSYGRIDYAFASKTLVPEVLKEQVRITHIPAIWLKASDHRPLKIVIDTSLEH